MLAVATLPATLTVLTLVGVLRRRRFVLVRMLLFVLVYSSLELVGLIGALFAGRSEARLYALQEWWACTLFSVACRLLSLRVDIQGEGSVTPGPILLFLRHASLADALLPAVAVTRPEGIQLRYVLKKELLVDPCLDVVGNRLPNHFVDRARPTPADLEAIATLAKDLGPQQGVIIYPEGTRFQPAKRARVLDKMKDSVHFERASRLCHTLPPRLGGLSALLDAAPDVDVVFCSHAGFEGFATFRDLISGDMVGRTLHIRFWRVPARDVPRDVDARTVFLYEQWQRVDDVVRTFVDEDRPSQFVQVDASAVA